MTIARSIPHVYARLGVRPVIHGAGTTTRYGGSLMRPETIEAMREAAQALVNIDELNEAAGAAIARMLGAEAALVTAGSDGGPRAPGRRVHHRRRPRPHRAAARRHRAAPRVRHPARPSLQLRPGVPRARRRPRRDRARAAHDGVRARARHRRADGGRHPPRLAVHEPARRARLRGGVPHRARARRARARGCGLDDPAARQPLPLPPRGRRSGHLQRGQGHPRARRAPASSRAGAT